MLFVTVPHEKLFSASVGGLEYSWMRYRPDSEKPPSSELQPGPPLTAGRGGRGAWAAGTRRGVRVSGRPAIERSEGRQASCPGCRIRSDRAQRRDHKTHTRARPGRWPGSRGLPCTRSAGACPCPRPGSPSTCPRRARRNWGGLLPGGRGSEKFKWLERRCSSYEAAKPHSPCRPAPRPRPRARRRRRRRDAALEGRVSRGG